ncbi:hypothetical protein CLOSTMETH_00132 [[Clostridium] methylpentosum DSM 5476]|uniref:Uncharacterized protein n=1 Tax=[Clostridium] methylpentosum DSM 5476 TaxID=537013 RepID=C0E8I8_9FIRM|nr:hypothetical protein CLOSTMETH_00132 [[Clostridium] methylpentosum DSM 5476]
MKCFPFCVVFIQAYFLFYFSIIFLKMNHFFFKICREFLSKNSQFFGKTRWKFIAKTP